MSGSASASEGFRADIEGLRALAILPILIFHLDPAAMPGGFIGVDIFFVISGFLISGQILRSRPDEFRFVQFYIRRIRRLFPALAVTVTVSLVFAWKLFTPSDLVGVAKSALASLAGVANIYFYASVDYFTRMRCCIRYCTSGRSASRSNSI
jgi:peptidoglycan/LPS O-acetylase OafA/YrhL